MLQELLAAPVDHRGAGGEELAIREIVVDEAQPGVEQESEGHGFYPPRFFVGPDGGGEVEADGRLDEDEAEPCAGGQEGRLDDKPSVEALSLSYAAQVRLEDGARPRSRLDELVKAERYGLAEILDDRDDEGFLVAEVNEDGALRHASLPRYGGGSRGDDALAGEDARRRIEYPLPRLAFLRLPVSGWVRNPCNC